MAYELERDFEKPLSKVLEQGDVVESGPFAGFEVLHVYTRAQAFADGVLVDVSAVAKEAGIKYPVALTRAVWADYVEVPKGLEGLQDVKGRLWDVLWMFCRAVANAERDGAMITFQLYVQMKRGIRPKLVTLKAIVGPGDDPGPVITIMKPDES
jgi:hypothetical protein